MTPRPGMPPAGPTVQAAQLATAGRQADSSRRQTRRHRLIRLAIGQSTQDEGLLGSANGRKIGGMLNRVTCPSRTVNGWRRAIRRQAQVGNRGRMCNRRPIAIADRHDLPVERT